MKASRNRYLTFIADDDQFIRQMLMRILTSLCDFMEFADGAGVAEAYKEHQPDVVFLDIHMPGISGLDLLREIKSIHSDAYIIMVTSDSSHENVIRAINDGASDFIAKPFDIKTVLEKFHASPAIKNK